MVRMRLKQLILFSPAYVQQEAAFQSSYTDSEMTTGHKHLVPRGDDFLFINLFLHSCHLAQCVRFNKSCPTLWNSEQMLNAA